MLRPHAARYSFIDALGAVRGQEQLEVRPRPRGWMLTSRLRLESPEPLSTEVEWHLESDLATHVLYVAATDPWGDEHTLELTVGGNGLLASRTGPDGPTQVEMGWGPAVELDHLSAGFTTVLLARWDRAAQPRREVSVVHVGAEDLVPEPLSQVYTSSPPDPATGITEVTCETPLTGARALLTVRGDGVVATYQGLFRLESVTFPG